jgi:tRNA uridine 5-carboxymethylaminomethyl modification enzyme
VGRGDAGGRLLAATVVLTKGNLSLDGKIHAGLNNYAAGRQGDPPAVSLSARLIEAPQGFSDRYAIMSGWRTH